MTEIFIHPTSLVETRRIGQGTQIWAFTHILKGACIGADCLIGDHCLIESGVTIADHVTIKHGNKIWAGVTLDNGAFVGPGSFLIHPVHAQTYQPVVPLGFGGRQWLVTTHIQEGAMLGAGAIILAGTRVGQFARIGDRAVVTKNVPAYALVRGDPAHIVGWVCQCGHPLRFQRHYAHCDHCQLNYVKDKTEIRPATF